MISLLKSLSASRKRSVLHAGFCFIVSGFAFAAIVGSQSVGMLEGLELAVYDRFMARTERAPDPRILILGINEWDIRDPVTGGWPLTDGKLAEALDILAKYKPAAIGLDLFRDLPIPNNGEQLAQLNRVLAENPNIIAITKFSDDDSPRIEGPAILKDNIERIGFNDFPVDPDKIIRRALLFLDDDDASYYSFALQLALLYLQPKGIFPSQPDEGDPDKIQIGKAVYQPFEPDDGGYVGADAGGYSFLMDFKGPEFFEKRSLVDLLTGKVKEEDVHGKIILIGSTAESLKDYYPSILRFRHYGIELHASVVNQLLRGAFDGEVPTQVQTDRAELLWILLWCIVGALTGLLGRSPARFVGTAIITFGVLSVTVFLLFKEGWWVISIAPALGWFFSALGVIAYLFVTEGREKKVIRNMFSTMVSPHVLQYMTDKPERFRLTGERKGATIFFSDIEGFTTIAESLIPEDLALVLNEYLTPMSTIILKYGGYIDKYEGDAIMADFGVPIWSETEPDSHGWKSCWAALEQQTELIEINRKIKEKFGFEIAVRMGINTGEVAAGNMGSEQKFQYTVMGDVVNQASRYEGANKIFGTQIMIGQSTYELAKDKIEARFLALLMVKGKTVPVAVYELLGRKGEITDEKLRLKDEFEKGWQLYASGQFPEAIFRFQEALRINYNDTPSQIYRKSCQQFLVTPPPPDWAGAWIQKQK